MPARYSLTEQDVVAGNDMWRRHQMNIWPLVAVMAFSWLLISAYFARTFAGFALAAVSFGVLTINLALAAVALWHGKRKSRLMAASTFRAASDQGREVKVTWNADGIEFSQRKANRKQAWREISHWAESDETFVMLGRGGMFNPIPKRAFSAADLEQIRDHLTRTGAKKAKLFFY
ncbi:YcxB family protein [Neorhizobium sp. JUb45]|uniref:YcxB family protein n=1 Tax=Neorhizobium sp. JUb45 TaxID=2485113 RepID=UPI00104845E3|nr:YcxB family protein [Neorhizobium sp. JUb45]TCR06680.1 YcxB-like protein [Neorhizobium sp. JUb45]